MILGDSGLGAIRILEAGHSVAFPELAGPAELDIGYGEPVEAIEVDGNGLVVTSKKRVYEARACLIAHRPRVDRTVPSQIDSCCPSRQSRARSPASSSSPGWSPTRMTTGASSPFSPTWTRGDDRERAESRLGFNSRSPDPLPCYQEERQVAGSGRRDVEETQ